MDENQRPSIYGFRAKMVLNAYTSVGHCVDRQSAGKEYQMKRVLVILVAAGLVLAPYIASVDAQSSNSNRPPIGQPLVSEGEFAVELATALNLSSSHEEAAAEDALGSISIAPRNGWISDYPMTPDIIAEVRESAARSASSGSLKMAEVEATGIVDSVSTAMNLPIEVAGGKGAYDSSSSSSSSPGYESGSSFEYQSSSSSEYQSSSGAPPPEVSEYAAPAEVEGYYNEYGPPIVSYYPPPWGYSSLYAWVPWPFWWGGFGFGGFFILNDFDRHDHFHHFSNHVTNANGSVSRINAVTRATATGIRSSSSLAGASRSTKTPAGSSRSAQGFRLGSSNARPSASGVMDRLAAPRAANTAGASTTPRNLASSGSSRSMGNTNGAGRNPVTATQIMDRLASTSHAQVMSQAAVARSASSGGRSFSNTASSRSSSGGSSSYGGGFRSSGSSFRGSGGSFRGSGSGFHGGGHGGGGHR